LRKMKSGQPHRPRSQEQRWAMADLSLPRMSESTRINAGNTSFRHRTPHLPFFLKFRIGT